MKMVKSLLLGSAAGLVAVAGAQAADLPVKAKPVEYVKICSLYGAGYYYIPGTDICLKFGGWVRYQHTWGAGGATGTQPFSQTSSRNTRTDTAHHFQRIRSILSVDTRQQTAYGTLRTYLTHGFSHDGEGAVAGLYSRRAFIQIAGFTFGRATSFFDLFSTASFAYNAGSIYAPDTGDAGQTVAAYTAQFGNGFSATVSLEAPKRNATINTNTAGSLGIAAAPTANNLATQYPDIVGNIRLDQAWGSVMVAGVLNDSSGGYYVPTVTSSGHPGNRMGYAVTGAFTLNLPMIAPGDRFSMQATYSEGATRYASNNMTGSLFNFNGQSVGVGWVTDGVFAGTAAGGQTDVNLTTAWAIAAGFEHLWTPALRTSLYGSYVSYSYNAQATASICTIGASATPAAGAVAFGAGCNPNFSMWSVGSRTQWEPVRGLIMGVDLMYQHLNSGRTEAAGVTLLTATGGRAAGAYTVSDQHQWYGTFRIQRDWVP